MFRSGHRASRCLGIRHRSDTRTENGEVTTPASAPGQQTVAAAIVTSRLGVLVGRRRDGSPPWTFPGGKIEPGESPEDAAVRETLEETELRVRATGVIGSRVHQMTGVRIVYVAAEVSGEPGVVSACSDELAEIRWVGLTEASELMSDMAEAVHRYLQRALGAGLRLFSDLGMAGLGPRDPDRVLVLVKQVEDPASSGYLDLPLLEFAAAVDGCGQISAEAAVPWSFRSSRGCAHQIPGLAGVAGGLSAKSLPA